MDKQECGNCKFNKREGFDCFTCDNEESESYGLETFFDTVCDDYELREEL